MKVSRLFVVLLLLPPISLAETPYWSGVGEGLTSDTGPARVSYRMFSAPDFEEICARPQPAYLAAADKPLVLTTGERFRLSNIQVSAYTSSHESLGGVALSVDIYMPEPVLELNSEWLGIDVLYPIAPGRFRIRVKTICDSQAPTLFLDAEVWER